MLIIIFISSSPPPPPILKFASLLSVNVLLTMYFAACTTGGVCYVAVEHQTILTDFQASQMCEILSYTGQDGVVHNDYKYAMLRTMDENNAASVATKDLDCISGGRGVMFGESPTSSFTNYGFGKEDQTKGCLKFYNEKRSDENLRGKWASAYCSSDNKCYACMRKSSPSSGSTTSGSTTSGSTTSSSTTSGSTSSGGSKSGGSKSGGSKSGRRRRV